MFGDGGGKWKDEQYIREAAANTLPTLPSGGKKNWRLPTGSTHGRVDLHGENVQPVSRALPFQER